MTSCESSIATFAAGLLCAVWAGCASPQANPLGCEKVVEVGQEHAVLEAYVTKSDNADIQSIQSDLEKVRIALTERAYPPMDRTTAAAQADLASLIAAAGDRRVWLLTGENAAAIKDLVATRESGKEPGFVGLDVSNWPQVKVLPSSPAEMAGMRNGDTIVGIGAKDAGEVKSPQEARTLLAGPVAGQVDVTVRRVGRPPVTSTPAPGTLTFKLQRASFAAMQTSCRQMDGGILYMHIPSFEGVGVGAKVKALLSRHASQTASAVILDLRDNPGGRAEEAGAVADLFLDNKLFEMFQFHDGRRVGVKSHPGDMALRVVVLANRNTGSAAEMLAMALRDNGRATIVGEPTAGLLFGKDAVELSAGRLLMFRTEPLVLSPTGRDYTQAGVPPDIAVVDTHPSPTTATTTLAGRGQDPILERALQSVRIREGP